MCSKNRTHFQSAQSADLTRKACGVLGSLLSLLSGEFRNSAHCNMVKERTCNKMQKLQHAWSCLTDALSGCSIPDRLRTAFATRHPRKLTCVTRQRAIDMQAANAAYQAALPPPPVEERRSVQIGVALATVAVALALLLPAILLLACRGRIERRLKQRNTAQPGSTSGSVSSSVTRGHQPDLSQAGGTSEQLLAAGAERSQRDNGVKQSPRAESQPHFVQADNPLADATSSQMHSTSESDSASSRLPVRAAMPRALRPWQEEAPNRWDASVPSTTIMSAGEDSEPLRPGRVARPDRAANPGQVGMGGGGGSRGLSHHALASGRDDAVSVQPQASAKLHAGMPDRGVDPVAQHHQRQQHFARPVDPTDDFSESLALPGPPRRSPRKGVSSISSAAAAPNTPAAPKKQRPVTPPVSGMMRRVQHDQSWREHDHVGPPQRRARAAERDLPNQLPSQ